MRTNSSKDFIFGAFDGEKLIGTLFGQRDTIRFDDSLTLETSNLGLLAVEPDYRGRGIAKGLIQKLITHAKKKKIDVILSFPEKGRFGDNILKDHFAFQKFGKTKHLLKLIGESGLQVLREYGYNPILVKIASLFARLPKLEEFEGIIRDGQKEDIEETVKLLNSYSTRVPLSLIYTVDDFENIVEGFSTMRERFGEPWDFHWLILEQDGKIVGTVFIRIEIVSYPTDQGTYKDVPSAILFHLGFHPDLDLAQKKKFIIYILHKVYNEVPDITTAFICNLQHEEKVFKKLRFVSDTCTFYLYIKPLTERGEALLQYKKYKKYLLEYYR